MMLSVTGKDNEMDSSAYIPIDQRVKAELAQRLAQRQEANKPWPEKKDA